MPRPVLLFKEPTPDAKYERVLSQAGYEARCVPVLETILMNVSQLAELLLSEQLSGIVLTSKRSCDSLSEALSTICTNTSESSAEPILARWCAIPFYVVGEGTAAAIRDIQTRFQSHGFSSVRTLGEASGTGEQLGHFIAEHYDYKSEGKLLYLTGDKNRDTVASILSKTAVPFRSLLVYETRKRLDFEEQLRQAVELLQSLPEIQEPWWTVYFAPSTAKFAIPAATNLLESQRSSSRIATIGPVTTSFIEDTLALPVHATAIKPNPQSLLDAILGCDR